MKITGFSFLLEQVKGAARAGILKTPHGEIKTPVFMPVGTQATVKSVDAKDLVQLGAQIVLANTYHLYLRPGAEVVAEMGGLHQIMRWPKPILTDSGGYQVSSLGTFARKSGERLSKVDEDGVTFRSHVDGSVHRLTPEISIETQEKLGADIIMAFDESTPDLGKEYATRSLRRTMNWLNRSVDTWKALELQKQEKPAQALVGIIQGGRYADLQIEAAKRVVEYDLPGIALGGEGIGGDMDLTGEVVAKVKPLIPAEKPLYTLGLGTSPNEVIKAIKMGVDMFDCVAPTRLARCGLLYHGSFKIENDVSRAEFVSEHPNQRIMIEKQIWAKDPRPIMEGCDCYTCTQGYSRAYLHHLFKAKELTYHRLATIHNLRVMVRTADLMRRAIVI